MPLPTSRRGPRAATALLLALAAPAWAQAVPSAPRKTQVTDARARTRLLGEHGLTLQWIATGGKYDVPGQLTVTEKDGLLSLQGEQRGDKDNCVQVQGVIERVDAKSFVLVGRVVTRVDHIAEGKACTREGRFTFRITGKRRYWRMKEMDSPCATSLDYVDIYLR